MPRFPELLLKASVLMGLGAAVLVSAALLTNLASGGALALAVQPASQAASLTLAQQQAVINLISSFGVDQAVIQRVTAALQGNYIAPAGAVSTITPSTTSCSFTHTLIVGSTGDDVSCLQQLLTQTGDYTYGSVTGYFGPATQAAVERYQAEHHIVSSGTPDTTGYGTVGPKTQAAMESDTTTNTTTNANITTIGSVVCPAYTVQCIAGYHAAPSSGTDTHGCALASTCVLDTGTSNTSTNTTSTSNTTSTNTSSNTTNNTSTNTNTTPASCALPWGGTLASGSNKLAYQSSSVAYGSSCVSETRTCTNSKLSGSYANKTCTVATAPPAATSYKVCNFVDATQAVHDTGYNYTMPFISGGDTVSSLTTSNVMLWEGSTKLGPAHSYSDDIRNLGAGRFLHWYSQLYFSTSDNSNPATNGRLYTYGVPENALCPTSFPFVVWGDSHTNDGRVTNDYPAQLAALTGYKVINEGEAGDTSTQILTRFLAASRYWGTAPTVIWAGHNDYMYSSDYATVAAQIKANIATMLSKLGGEYYVLSLMIPSNPKGSPAYNALTQLNSDLKAIYGKHYVDVEAALVAAYDPNNAQDVIDHNNDNVPTSLTLAGQAGGDAYHLNSKGDAVVALAVYQALTGQYVAPVNSAATSCALPWGGTLASGSSKTAWQSSSASSCVSETRACTNGKLSGSYTYQSCTTTGTTPTTATPKNIFLTSGSSWTVPSDWNSANNSIEAIGGGGGGGGGDQFWHDGAGGGAYSKATNISLTAGASVSYSVGAGGTAGGGTGGDSYFNGASCGSSSVCAKGGAGSGCGSGLCGTYYGGQASAGVGTTKYSGGNGGVSSNANGLVYGGGGGSAAGPSGAGGSGFNFTAPAGSGSLDSSHAAGAGGYGGTSNGFSGSGGSSYGGGGGGAYPNGYGGAGGSGIIEVTYTP